MSGVYCVEAFEGPLEGVGELVEHLRVGAEVGVRGQHGNVLRSVVVVVEISEGMPGRRRGGLPIHCGRERGRQRLERRPGLERTERAGGKKGGTWLVPWLVVVGRLCSLPCI